MKSIRELESISPFIANVQTYENITSSKVGNTVASLDWIHLQQKNLIKAEYAMLCYEAKQCCTYDEEKEVYDMDLYWCMVYDDTPTNIPTWWNSIIELLDESKYGTTQILVNIESDAYMKIEDGSSDVSSDGSSDGSSSTSNPLDSLYIERYSNEVEKLDILMCLDWTLLSSMKKCFPVPFLGTPTQIARRMCGAMDDEPWLKKTVKNVEAYLVDPSVAWHTFGPLQNEPCLQDIVFHGCTTHDQVIQQDFTYSYKINGITIVCEVSKLVSDPTKCTLRFKTLPTVLLITSDNIYIGWNGSVSEELLRCIDYISDATTYRKTLQYRDK